MSRQEELDKLSEDALAAWNEVLVLSDTAQGEAEDAPAGAAEDGAAETAKDGAADTADTAEAPAVADANEGGAGTGVDARPSGLHAKMSAVEHGRRVTWSVGSANLTAAAFTGGNVEMMASVSGTKGGADGRGVGHFLDGGFRKLCAPYRRVEQEAEDAQVTDARARLEAACDALVDARLRVVCASADDLWTLTIDGSVALPADDVEVAAWPVSVAEDRARRAAGPLALAAAGRPPDRVHRLPAARPGSGRGRHPHDVAASRHGHAGGSDAPDTQNPAGQPRRLFLALERSFQRPVRQRGRHPQQAPQPLVNQDDSVPAAVVFDPYVGADVLIHVYRPRRLRWPSGARPVTQAIASYTGRQQDSRKEPTMEYRRPRHAFVGNDAIAGESCAVGHRRGRSLAATSPWIGFILIPVICSVACGMAASSETVVVDDTGGAPLSGNSREVSPATVETLSNESSLQATEEEALSGRWFGRGYQPGVDSSWSIEITFGDDGIDIGYPSIPCGGELQPVSVSGRRFEYRERLRFGLSECVNNGRVVLERTGPNALSYEWYGESDTLEATGSLTRRTSG